MKFFCKRSEWSRKSKLFLDRFNCIQVLQKRA